MNTLCTRNDLLASDEDIKGVAELWVRGAGHGVEWPHLQHVRQAVHRLDTVICCW